MLFIFYGIVMKEDFDATLRHLDSTLYLRLKLNIQKTEHSYLQYQDQINSTFMYSQHTQQ